MQMCCTVVAQLSCAAEHQEYFQILFDPPSNPSSVMQYDPISDPGLTSK